MLTTDPNNILKKHITNKLGFTSNKKEDPIIKINSYNFRYWQTKEEKLHAKARNTEKYF